MGLLSSSVPLTRYVVKDEIHGPVLDTVRNGLKKFTMAKNGDEETIDKVCGWTSLEQPYDTNFDKDHFVFGTYFVFCLRIDKKSISAKIIKKHVTQETNKRLSESKREYLSKSEKKTLKEDVILLLSKRIPATPSTYDIVWDYEKSSLWFFSNLKAANEELETLFTKSFNLHLIRQFPYTAAYLQADEKELNQLSALTSTFIME